MARRLLPAVREKALSRFALERVLRDVNPDTSRDGGLSPSVGQVEALRAVVNIKPQGRAAFLIECVHADPGKAASISNRVASLLIEQAEVEWLRKTEAKLAFEKQLIEAREVIEDRRSALQRLREDVRGASSNVREETAARVERVAAEARAIAADLATARMRADSLQRAIEAEGRQPPAAANKASIELTSLQAQLTELRKRYKDEHPDVVALRRQIGRLEGAIPSAAEEAAKPESQLQTELSRVKREIEDLRQRSAHVDRERAELQGDWRHERPTADSIEGLTRGYAEAIAGYAKLQEESRAAEVASRIGGETMARFELLQAADAPPRPCFPSRRLFALVGLAVGLSVGLLVAVGAERRDASIRGPEDLRQILPQPLLAEIPPVRTPRPGRRG